MSKTPSVDLKSFGPKSEKGKVDPRPIAPASSATGPRPPAKNSGLYPINLADLLRKARSKKVAGETQWDILQWVYDAADNFGIRVRCEERCKIVVPTPDTPDITSPSVTTVLGEPPTSSSATIGAKPDTVAQDDAKPDVKPSEKPGEKPDVKPDVKPDAKPNAKPDAKTEDDSDVAGKKKKAGHTKKDRRTIPVSFQRDATGKTHMVLYMEQLLDPEFDPREKMAAEKHMRAAHGADDSTSDITRLIMSCDRHNVKSAAPICAECNGVVIDARSWHLLAMPPRAFNPRHNAKMINDFLSKGLYDIIPVPDGTVVTMYPWNPTATQVEMGARAGYWALASTHGYDVSTLKWMGPLAYAEIFDRIASTYPAFYSKAGVKIVRHGDAGPFLFCGDLDRSKCYTLGFRHHDFHPMTWDPQGMWQIQYTHLLAPSSDESAGERVVCWDDGGGLPGIPWQKVADPLFFVSAPANTASVEAAKTAETEGDTSQQRSAECVPVQDTTQASVGVDLVTLDVILDSCKNAVEEAKILAANWAADPAAPPTARANYGYILRSKDPQITGEHSDFLIESPLLRRVRKILYQRPSRTVREELNSENRLDYNALRMFLTAADREELITLFPSWKKRFNDFEEFINNVVHNVVHIHRQASMGAASRVPVPKSSTTLVARALLDHITRHETISAFHRDTESVVRDYALDPSYALVYLKALKVRK